MSTVVFSGSVEKMINGIEAWQRDSDATIAAAIAKMETDETLQVSCHSCDDSACCRNKIHVRLADAFPIVRHLLAKGLASHELREQLRTTGDEMEKSGTGEWLERYVPCVFLEDGRCSIYEYRPLPCRTYFVVSDPKLCQPPPGKDVQYVNVEKMIASWEKVSQQVHAMFFSKETLRGAQSLETRKRIFLATFPRAVLILLEALESDDYRQFVRTQEWPSDTTIQDGWREGKHFVGLP